MDGLVRASFSVHLNECVSAMYRDTRYTAISREKVFQVSFPKISGSRVQVTNEKAGTLHMWIIAVCEVLSKALRPVTVAVTIPRTRSRACLPGTSRIRFLVHPRIVLRIPLVRHPKHAKQICEL